MNKFNLRSFQVDYEVFHETNLRPEEETEGWLKVKIYIFLQKPCDRRPTFVFCVLWKVLLSVDLLWNTVIFFSHMHLSQNSEKLHTDLKGCFRCSLQVNLMSANHIYFTGLLVKKIGYSASNTEET